MLTMPRRDHAIMSCWVVPAIAAEYLNTTLEDVLWRIQNGSIPVRYEDGFTFVDVLPEVHGEGKPVRPAMTYVPADDYAPSAVIADNPDDSHEMDDVIRDSDTGFSWKTARQQAAQRRQRPVAA